MFNVLTKIVHSRSKSLKPIVIKDAGSNTSTDVFGIIRNDTTIPLCLVFLLSTDLLCL